MRELSEATMDHIEFALVDHTHTLVTYCDPRVPKYRAALAEFRAWREHMAQRQSFARGNVAIDRDPDARRTVAVEGDDGAEQAKATEPGECSRCGGSGFIERPAVYDDGSYSRTLNAFDCEACDGTGKRKGGE